MINEAVAKHVAQAMANIRQPADGAPGPAGPSGKLEIVKDYIEGQVYTTATSSSETMARCIKPIGTLPQAHHTQIGAASPALAAMARTPSTSASKARITQTRNIAGSRS